MTKPQEHRHWTEFELHCLEFGINLEDEPDWRPWWECFLAGANAEIQNPDSDPKE